MSTKSWRYHLKYWWVVYILLIFAGLVVYLGIDGVRYIRGCSDPICNALRSLQWESLTAGLLGLIGGVAVVVVTRRQMENANFIAKEAERRFLSNEIDNKLTDLFEFMAECELLSVHVKNHLRKVERCNEEHRKENNFKTLEKTAAEFNELNELRDVLDLLSGMISHAQIYVPSRVELAFLDTCKRLAILIAAVRSEALGAEEASVIPTKESYESFTQSFGRMTTKLSHYRTQMLSIRAS